MTEPVLVLERDLFFVVKIRETLKAAGCATLTAKSASEFAERLAAEPRPICALIHFGAPGVAWEDAIRAAHAAGIPALAYGSHVDLAAQSAARAAGATRVIANSKLAANIPAQIDQTIARAAANPAPADDRDDLDDHE